MPNFSGLWTARQQLQATGESTWPAVPGAPTIGTATIASATSVSVGFTAPSNTGYPASITGYTVTSSPGGLTGTGASSPITVTGLTTGTAYTFTVTATNATGTGPASAASNSVTPVANYIEDVFSTYLYTGAGTAQTVTNNIDLSTNGGLVWIKNRGTGSTDHQLVDTARGAYFKLSSNLTNTQANTSPDGISAFNTNGFSIGGNYSLYNTSGSTYASWTFRKQPKFFDVVTYTGNGSSQAIAHNLGSSPGAVFIKRTNAVSDWVTGFATGSGVSNWASVTGRLNTTAAFVTNGEFAAWSSTAVTVVNSGGSYGDVNTSGATYVMYVFASNAGGFGLTGADNVISCGSVVTDGGGNATVNLGFEPQWILVKKANGSENWYMFDDMRGFTVAGSLDSYFVADTNAAEGSASWVTRNATGFALSDNVWGTSNTYVYIAIRRGPMKVPTDATKVFSPIATTAGVGTAITTNLPMDMQLWMGRSVSYGLAGNVVDRLRGVSTTASGQNSRYVLTTATAAEATTYSNTQAWSNTGFKIATVFDGLNSIYWNFQRAPSFFDEVCYTGTGANRTVTHNLGVAPELMWIKCRSGGNNWRAYSAGIGATKTLYLNSNDAGTTDAAAWNNTAPTSSVFTVGTSIDTNDTGQTYVAYLFATCAGVSKVGSYTGTGATQTVSCGFAGGARFVLVKRIDSTGDWYVWDTARGMVSGTDPSLQLNSTAAEVNANSIYTTTGGFQIVSTAAGINASGGTYIFLAIA